jgi:hypothetical protein
VLRDTAAAQPLLTTLTQVDRLVLLGDVIELRQGPVRDALAVASGILPAFSEALRDGREVVIVPGNHDHQLLAPWFARRADRARPPAMGSEAAVDWRAREPLGKLVKMLAGAEVRVAYPGVWLREDIYATHGHYLDRHTTIPMFERLGAGAMARVVRSPPAIARRAEDYEEVLAPIYAWIAAIAQFSGDRLGVPGRSSHGASTQVWQTLGRGARAGGWRRRGTALALRGAIAALNRAGLGPLRADLSVQALRRAGLLAFGEVLSALGVEASSVIFGHTHRAGPLPRDDHSEWTAAGGIRLLNTGCWVHEPAFLGPRPSQSPYRAGFAVVLEDGGPPALVNLLDPADPESPGLPARA